MEHRRVRRHVLPTAFLLAAAVAALLPGRFWHLWRWASAAHGAGPGAGISALNTPSRLSALRGANAPVTSPAAALVLAGPAAVVAAATDQDAAAATEEQAENSPTALVSEILDKVQPKIERWEKTANEGRTVLGFGPKAANILNRSLVSFDQLAEQRFGADGEMVCAEEREALNAELKRRLHSIFLVQRSSIEEALYQKLKRDLLRRMRRKHKELPVKEKLKLMHAAMKEYDTQVRELQPDFVENSERDRAERRLSELQFGILDSPEGQELQQRWKMDRMRRNPMRQSRGISISLSPGMRLMFRPEGLGNLQLSSKRQVGPPHNPNEVSIAMLNDGKVIDVYQQPPQPRPPLIKFQPTVALDLSLG